MNHFVHICALMIASTSANTGATQVQPQEHSLVQPQMNTLMHLYGDD